MDFAIFEEIILLSSLFRMSRAILIRLLFWIDMSKLFELYVYSLLKDAHGSTIQYQPSKDVKRQNHGCYGDIDFLKLDEKILNDTKYKEVYKDEYKIEDIRQLSGYARDYCIGKNRSIESDKIMDCIIICPDKNANEHFKNKELKETAIKQFTKFYKCRIKLPSR
ncbi:5-methylcytosine restriction system specificity protein McrC [Riemerella columbipharyngis]|uniref:McrBC 5-methylcytosine restriction system component n=1 Tax=Riemerella columbipharyngis TaxID=1071918 RepID=A0A1G7CVP7_9FLAO|nr:hypothetical protein [Riemerella columbipharyngis]SDE43389.1 McrBC 5-methylcytosine restriction system component [Riemerella columbipharyngis]